MGELDGGALSRLASAGWEEHDEGGFRLGYADEHQPSLMALPGGMPEEGEQPTLTVLPPVDLIDDPDPPDAMVLFFDSVEEMVEFALDIQQEFEATYRDLDAMAGREAGDDTEFDEMVSVIGGVPAAVAIGWHDYARALLVATGATRLACGAGLYRDYNSALSDHDIVAVTGYASRWALRELREALALGDGEDIFDAVAAATAELLAQQIASECSTTDLSDAITAPWRRSSADNAVPCEVFVAALTEEAAAHPTQPLSPAQATSVIEAVSNLEHIHSCVDEEPGEGFDSDRGHYAACEIEQPYVEAFDDCLRWHTQPPSNASARARPIQPRKQAKLLVEAAVEFSHIPLILDRARRRIAAGARAAVNGEYLSGVDVTLEDLALACSDIIFVGWDFLYRWVDAYAEQVSARAAAKVVRAAGDLWHSELVGEHDQTLLDRLQNQFGWPAEHASEATAEKRASAREASWNLSQTVRVAYGVKIASRRRHRR